MRSMEGSGEGVSRVPRIIAPSSNEVDLTRGEKTSESELQ